MSTEKKAISRARSGKREANVLVEMYMADAMSFDVLDANSDDVLEAVEKHAAEIALGPTIALNVSDCSIRLRFDVVARNETEIYKQIAKVVAVIEKHTDLSFEATRGSVEAHGEHARASTSRKYAAC